MRIQIWETGAEFAPNRIIVNGNNTEVYCDFCHMENRNRPPMRPCGICNGLIKEIVESNNTVGGGIETEYLIRQYNARIIKL